MLCLIVACWTSDAMEGELVGGEYVMGSMLRSSPIEESAIRWISPVIRSATRAARSRPRWRPDRWCAGQSGGKSGTICSQRDARASAVGKCVKDATLPRNVAPTQQVFRPSKRERTDEGQSV